MHVSPDEQGEGAAQENDTEKDEQDESVLAVEVIRYFSGTVPCFQLFIIFTSLYTLSSTGFSNEIGWPLWTDVYQSHVFLSFWHRFLRSHALPATELVNRLGGHEDYTEVVS